jgi:Acyl-CoA dehydrogenase, C-terminal domain
VTVVAASNPVNAGVADPAELALLAETFRKTMAAASGHVLDIALAQLGWRDLLAELPGVAIPMVFTLLGETGAHAPILNDVVLCAAGRSPGDTVPLPYAGGSWVVWERSDWRSAALDGELPLRPVPGGSAGVGGLSPAAGAGLAGDGLAGDGLAGDGSLAAGRRAVGWWLVGTGRAMLALARSHALDRVQFGRPLASFQAVRHRLAETLVALEGAEGALGAADDLAGASAGASADALGALAGGSAGAGDAELAALLAKAAAGQAALTAARHCQQVLGGIGFTAEHGLNQHVRRALVLDGLLGSARELTREAGARLVAERSARRLVDL